MGEYYNWRAEREKYRSNKPQKEEQKSTVASAEVQEKPSALFEDKNPLNIWSEDSALKLSQMAEKYKKAVGLVSISFEDSEENKIQIPIGTAWAFDQNKFATNAHVALGLKSHFSKLKEQFNLNISEQTEEKGEGNFVKKLVSFLCQKGKESLSSVCAKSLSKGIKCKIIINGSQYEQGYTISHVQIHSNYGKDSSPFSPDVAIFTIEEKHDTYFPLASQKCLHDLKAGLPIAFLGFPMESLLAGNINLENPIASMQTGIIVAVSDFEMKDAGGKGNVLIRHNLPAVGGASGSPIFDAQGQVVALLYAGNMIGQVQEGEIKRAPSAALINFGVRSDLLQDMGKPIKIRDFLEK